MLSAFSGNNHIKIPFFKFALFLQFKKLFVTKKKFLTVNAENLSRIIYANMCKK